MAAWLIYACIAGGGLLFLVLSLFLGGDGHDTGSAGVHHPGVEVAGDGASHSLSDLGSWLSLTVASAFAVGFGATGAGATILFPDRPLLAGGVAMGFGIMMAATARGLMAFLVKRQGSAHVVDSEIMGQTGVVSQTILVGRAGEIEVAGIFRPARSTSEVELMVGTAVRVVQMGSTLTVEPVNPQK